MFLFALVGLFLVSCSKSGEEVIKEPQKKSTQYTNLKFFSCLPSNGNYPCGPGSGCYSPGFSCLGEVDVTPTLEPILSDLNDQIANGNVTEFFSNIDKYPELFPSIDSLARIELANGTRKLYKAESEDLTMYIFEPLSN